MLRSALTLVVLLGLLTPFTGSAEPVATSSAAEQVDFDRDIRPILSNTCFTCHGPDANKRATDLRFDVESSLFAERDEPVIVRGQPAASALIQRIVSGDPDIKMPPPDQKQQLSAEQIELLKRWVAQGAPYSGHWSFQKINRPDLPALKNTPSPNWPANEIDHFILARLQREGLTPSPRATRETLIRRASLDLTGLPPTLAEVDAFLADDSEDDSADAFEKVVDRLLASERFGEHMSLSWLDAARYADSNGYQQDRTRTLWPWRDWVVRAFNSNMPFDRFSIEQLAGDLLENPTTDQLVATGFHRNHMLNGEGGRIAEESRVDYVIDRAETTGAVWLGLTVGCGRCHDHKYDPFSQREFYQLYSYFNSIDESGSVDAGGNARPVLAVPTAEQLTEQSDLQKAIQQHEQELKTLQTPERRTDWETTTLARLKSQKRSEYWVTLKPESAVSQEDQTVTIEPDGVIFVTGKNPARDNYTVELATELEQITGIRIEALPHADFTNGGLARSDSGNFVLTEFIVEARSANDDKPQRVTIASALATFEQGGWPVKNAFDGNNATGWAVHNAGDMKIARRAAFVFDKPIAGGLGTRFRLRLEHQSPHPNHNLGRFRIAVTTQPTPKPDASDDGEADLLAALNAEAAQRSDAQKKLLADEFVKRDPELVAAQKQIDAARKRLDGLNKSITQTMIMKDRAQPRETFVLIRGLWDQPDKEQPIKPGTPEVLPPLPADAAANRLALARWLVAPNNPLTPRVIVNRFWQQIFGIGLVATPEDFGSQGERPSHPQLLDWLAADFVESGWDVKRLLKQMMMSATWQQSSAVTPELLEVDQANRLLARGSRYRLTAQAIRDQALALSGLLVNKLGGAPVKPYQPLGIWSDLSLGKIKYQQDSGENLYRRSLYTFWRRASAPTMLFDVASRQVCKVRTSRTNTPLHALVLLNDVTFTEAARKLAERVMTDGGETPETQLAHAFRLATSRRPTSDEQAAMLAILQQVRTRFAASPEEAPKLLAIGDSLRNESLDPVELASMTSVMSVILNLDEVLTRE
jgi:hypothetical protein